MKSVFTLLIVLLTLSPLGASGGYAAAAESQLVFSCRTDNDLYRVMTAAGINCRRYQSPAEAVHAASEGSGVLILADDYPDKTIAIAPAVFDEAARKKLRLYVEYPAALPGMTVGAARRTSLERVVTVSDAFGESLKKMQIVAVHDCHFVDVPAERPHLVVAKVAGFDRAVYGLADTKQYPILFEHPNGTILVSTTKLSQFVTARYAPKDAMQAIWRFVFGWLEPGSKPLVLDWTPAVRPTFDRNASIPADAARRAVQRGIDWHTNARMLLSENGWTEYRRRCTGKPPGLVGAMPDARWPAGDGRFGVMEGVNSQINADGSQPVRWWLRVDSNGESALAFALRWKMDNDQRSRAVAGNLLDWLYFRSSLFENDSAKANYGLFYWGTDHTEALYHDNDVKVILGCLGTAGLLETDRWDEVILKNILGNFRTTGVNGFRGGSLSTPQMTASGWQKYWRANTVLLQPHYESWIWATYLWLYDKTHYRPLLERTCRGIRMMMAAYPDRWSWTNGFQQERGRMLLPLAWLVRIDDKPEHRAWLKRIATDIEKCQDACGAIREELGPLKQGSYRPPKSNADYGKAEASLIHENGDTVADLLYTCNFTLVGLHEAHAATGDVQYKRMADRLADFLVRIQIRSETHPELDGGWFRAFDYRKWEYWGSNADAGWGAWAIEVGWTQAWIPTVLAMREINTSLWDLSKHSRVKDRFELIRKQMLPDEELLTREPKK